MIRVLGFVFLTACCISSTYCRTDPGARRRPDMTAIVIASDYPDSIYFTVNSVSEKSMMKTGFVPGFQSRDTIEREACFQRLVRQDGKFRIIHVAGSGIRTVNDEKRSVTKVYHFRDSIRFDTLGYFDKPSGDPLDLVPLYPGRPVKVGEQWTPQAKVKVAMGEGTAQFVFSADSLYAEKSGAVMARVLVNFKGDLNPIPVFSGGAVTVSGSGWLLWDCSINQRRETHLQAVYAAKTDSGSVIINLKFDDALQKHSGNIDF